MQQIGESHLLVISSGCASQVKSLCVQELFGELFFERIDNLLVLLSSDILQCVDRVLGWLTCLSKSLFNLLLCHDLFADQKFYLSNDSPVSVENFSEFNGWQVCAILQWSTLRSVEDHWVQIITLAALFQLIFCRLKLMIVFSDLVVTVEMSLSLIGKLGWIEIFPDLVKLIHLEHLFTRVLKFLDRVA